MIEMVHARVGFACVCGGGLSPPSWPTMHQSARSTPSVFPSHPTSVRGTLSPFCCLGVPSRSIRVRSLPFHPVESSSVVRSPPVHPGVRDAPSPCARDTARATPRAPAHAHPARPRHTLDPHPTPNTALVRLKSQEESRDAGGVDVELAEVGTPAPSRHKRGNPHGHSAARGPPCWCNTPCRRRRRQPPAPSRTCRWSRSPAPRPRGTRPGG